MLYSLLVRPSGVAAFQSRLFKDPSSSNLVFKDRTAFQQTPETLSGPLLPTVVLAAREDDYIDFLNLVNTFL
jgi:hypothetical protein